VHANGLVNLRKLPLLTADNRDFWTGGAAHQLRINYCRDCARLFHPPAPICPRCAGADVVPMPVSGRGSIVTFTVNHQAWVPDLAIPYVIAIVALDEDSEVRFVTNVVGTPVQQVHIGMPVRVVFERHEDVWLPLFEKAS
jgi:uncharacterized OB-fold protein